MGNNLKSFRTDRIIFAAGAIVLGIVLLVWPSTSLLIMGKCIGAILAAGGLAAVFMFFRNHESAMKSVLLIMAAVMLICGVVIFLHPEDLVRLIPTIMGILVLISGLISGILIFDGVSDLWVISRISKVSKDMAAEASAVDAEATVTDAGAASAGNVNPGDMTNTPAETEDQTPSGETALQPPLQPQESSTVPEYMAQTEQDTDFSAFAGTDSAGNGQDENKQPE